ncbi:MAG: hypothetical protein AAB573_00355 [Patescibacteria group bacterium]
MDTRKREGIEAGITTVKVDSGMGRDQTMFVPREGVAFAAAGRVKTKPEAKIVTTKYVTEVKRRENPHFESRMRRFKPLADNVPAAFLFAFISWFGVSMAKLLILTPAVATFLTGVGVSVGTMAFLTAFVPLVAAAAGAVAVGLILSTFFLSIIQPSKGRILGIKRYQEPAVEAAR